MTFRLIRRFGKQYGRNIGNDVKLLAQIWDDEATGFPVALLSICQYVEELNI